MHTGASQLPMVWSLLPHLVFLTVRKNWKHHWPLVYRDAKPPTLHTVTRHTEELSHPQRQSADRGENTETK